MTDRRRGDDPVVAVDLFCGPGGLSWALAEVCEHLDREIELHAINHWERAIETHERNHPWANHYHAKIEELAPSDIVEEGRPTILVGGIECTYFSTALGGKPINEQKRMPAAHVLTWIQKLRPKIVLFENVMEFEDWGPVEDGQPSRNGEVFEAWRDFIHALGYNVDTKVLNAADYGDATSRRRLFIAACREGRPTWPEPTHSEDGQQPGTKPWRPAAEVIDWSDVGESIWTRGLFDARKKPLKYTTMRRIAEGIRRFGDGRLEAFADALDWIGRVDPDKDDVNPDNFVGVEDLRERVVPAEYARLAADVLDEPFLVRTPLVGDPATASLVKYYGTATAKSVTDPVDTITAGGQKFALSVPYVLGQQSGSRPRAVTENPLPTIASRGAISLLDPAAMVLPRNGYYRGLHSNRAYDPRERPLHTVTARNHDGWTVTPYLVPFYGETNQRPRTHDVDAPVPTITATGSDPAVSQPYLVPFYGERDGQTPRTHDITDPLPTVPASKSPAGVSRPFLVKYYGREDAVQGVDEPMGTIRTANTFGVLDPFLVSYHGNSDAHPVTRPLPTLTTTETLALCLPEHYPWGLDVRFRMLQPRELAAAMGFPPDFEFQGNKGEVTEQIGNAVPVNLGAALIEHLLTGRQPSLRTYTDAGDEAADEFTPGDGVSRVVAEMGIDSKSVQIPAPGVAETARDRPTRTTGADTGAEADD